MRKNVRSNVDKLGELITQTFPPVKLAFGYGSAFFKQKDYDYKKNQVPFRFLFRFPILNSLFMMLFWLLKIDYNGIKRI